MRKRRAPTTAKTGPATSDASAGQIEAPISAFAAARQPLFQADSAEDQGGQREPQNEFHILAEVTANGDDVDLGGAPDQESAISDAEEEAILTTAAESKKATRLSSWRPSKENVLGWRKGWLRLSLAGDSSSERLTLIGQYQLRVVRGSVRVYGATLGAGPRIWRVFAPSSHALPSIAASGPDNNAIVEVSQMTQSMDHLSALSPLFRKLWNDPRTKEAPELQGTNACGFSYLEYDRDDSLRRPLHALDLRQPMEEFMTHFGMTTDRQVVYVCGRHNAGKSTFGRALINCATTATPASLAPGSRRPVCYLDLDPGQTEFTPAASVSLVLVRDPQLSPPFAHPFPETVGGFRVIKAHAVVTTRFDVFSERYTECCLDLFKAYRLLVDDYPSEGAPSLIVNTPAMTRGFGEEMQRNLDFVDESAAKHIVYFGYAHDHMCQVIRQHAQKRRVLLHQWEPLPVVKTNRTSSHLRDMMLQSYFHAMPPRTVEERLAWHADCVCSTPRSTTPAYFASQDGTDETRASDEGVRLAGVVHMGRATPPGQLQRVLAGNIAAVVRLPRAGHQSLAWIDEDGCAQAVLPGNSDGVVHASQQVALCLVQTLEGGRLQLYSPEAPMLCAPGEERSELALYRRQLHLPAWIGLEGVHLMQTARQQVRQEAVARGLLTAEEASLVAATDAAMARYAAAPNKWAAAAEAADAWRVQQQPGESEGERTKRQRAFEYSAAVWRGVPRAPEQQQQQVQQ